MWFMNTYNVHSIFLWSNYFEHGMLMERHVDGYMYILMSNVTNCYSLNMLEIHRDSTFMM